MRLGNVTETWDAMDELEWDMDDWIQFRTTNVSLKREFVDIRFDEEMFHASGIEDTEFGYRLFLKGMKIVYNNRAVSWHYHFRSPEGYLRKVERYGELFARWEDNCDGKTAAMLNKKFNYLLDMKKPFSWGNIRELLRRLAINDLTAPVIRGTAMFLKDKNEKTSLFLFNKLYKYLFLKGYRAEKRKIQEAKRKK
jgi:GT2 family glycosyltransferase